MSEEYYNSLEEPPRIKEGLRMKLNHLTGRAKVLGYINTHLYLQTTCGKTIQFELEAYVVRNMKVPLLLGEDFQTSYELGLDHSASGHSTVRVGRDCLYTIDASSALSVDLGFELR